MKKLFLASVILLSLTGCGTLLTERKELISVSTNVETPVKLYLNNRPMGNQKQVYVRNTGWGKDTVMAENEITGEKRIVPLEYGFNPWAVPSIFFGVIGVGVDLVTGSFTELKENDYYINFETNKQ